MRSNALWVAGLGVLVWACGGAPLPGNQNTGGTGLTDAGQTADAGSDSASDATTTADAGGGRSDRARDRL